MQIDLGDKDHSLFDSVEIKGLFGDQNEYISFDENEYIKILYGLNASGKSTVLSIIEAVLSSDYVSLFRLPFDEVIFRSKRETARESHMVPMNRYKSENIVTDISDLIDNSPLDITPFLGEASEDEGPGYDIERLEIPGDVFLDEHTLKIRRFRPDSMKINVGDLEEPADKVGLLLELHHELLRSIPSLSKADPKLFQALSESNYHNLPYDAKKEYFDSFGGNSVVEFVVRSLDEYDFRTEHWRELKTELAHLFTIRIDDYDTPERYHWNDNLITLRDIHIDTLAGENNHLDTQNFIENLLPKQNYRRMVNSAKNNTARVTRHYFDAEKIPIGTIGSERLDLRLGTGLNCGPIEYFLQTINQTYQWNGPSKPFPSFEIRPQTAGAVSTDSHYRLNLTTYPNPKIIHLSAARTVGDYSSEYSELYEFNKSMKSKISDAVKFLKQQSDYVKNLELPLSGLDEDEPINEKRHYHCIIDSKSTEFGILSQEIDVFKRSIVEKKRSRIIDETDTYLDLIESSIFYYRDQIRQLTGINPNWGVLHSANNVVSDNIIYAHDHDIF